MGVGVTRAATVAAVTIVGALAGTAVASDPTDSASAVSKKKVKRIAAKQAGKAIEAAAPGLSVAEAKKADSATRATSAVRADTAARAGTLAGLGPGQFLRSSKVQFGGPVPSDQLFQRRLLSFPGLGIQVRTDGDLDTAPDIRIINTDPPGGRRYLVNFGDVQSGLNPGDNDVISLDPATRGGQAFIFPAETPGSGVLVNCANSAFAPPGPVIACLGISS
jgi:hypothetical protein